MWAATALGAAQEEGACAQEGTTLKPHQPSPVYKNLLYAESKVTGATNVMGGDCCWETSAMQGRRKKLVQPFSGKLRHCTSSSETCIFKQILGSWAKQNELVLLTLDSRTQSLVALASSKLPLNVSSQREDIPVGKDYQQLVLFQTNVHLLLQAVFRYLVAVSSYSHAETQKLMSKPETRKKIYSSKARVRSRKVQCSKWPKKFEGISGFGQFGLHFFLEFQSFSETWIVFILISLGHGASAITSTPGGRQGVWVDEVDEDLGEVQGQEHGHWCYSSATTYRAKGKQPPAAMHRTTWVLIVFLLGLSLLSVVSAALPSPMFSPAKAAGWKRINSPEQHFSLVVTPGSQALVPSGFYPQRDDRW